MKKKNAIILIVCVIILVLTLSVTIINTSLKTTKNKTEVISALQDAVKGNMKNAFVKLKEETIKEEIGDETYNPTTVDNLAELTNKLIVSLDANAADNKITTNKTISTGGIVTPGTSFTNSSWHSDKYYVVVSQSNDYGSDEKAYISIYYYVKELENAIGMTIKLEKGSCDIIKSCYDSSESDYKNNPFNAYRGGSSNLGIQL